MSASSPVLNHLFNSVNPQKPPSARPELHTESDRLELLLDLTNTLVSSLECRDLLRMVSASIRRVMHCDTVGVWLPDAQQSYLRQLAMDFPEGKGLVREDLLHPVEGSLLGRVFKAGKPLVLDVMSEQMALEESPEARAEALESGCALPLISRGRTLGVLTLASRVPNSFSSDDVEFLMRAAGQVALAIEDGFGCPGLVELKDHLARRELYFAGVTRGLPDLEGVVGRRADAGQ